MAIDLTKLEKKFIDLFANVTQEEFEQWLLTKNKPMAQQKLYTKLQVSEAITLARLTDDSTSDIFKQLTPIELPIIEYLKEKPMAQQTAVEWLIMQLPVKIRVELYEQNIHEQAKQMERKQHKDTWDAGMSEGIGTTMGSLDYDGEFINYYNETYIDATRSPTK